jgi:BMFP domain-containing protein YqiC
MDGNGVSAYINGMQTKNPLFEDLANLLANAAGAARAAGEEAKTALRGQADRLVAEMDLVGRDEFEAMKTAALDAKAECEALRARVAVLEAKLGLSQETLPKD